MLDEGVRCAPPTSTSSTSPATASPPGAAARCSTPIASACAQIYERVAAFHRELGAALGAGAAAGAAGRARARTFRELDERAAAADERRDRRRARRVRPVRIAPDRRDRPSRRRRRRLHAVAASARRRIRSASPTASSTGPPTRPTARSWRSASAERRLRRRRMADAHLRATRSPRVRGIAQALLDRRLSARAAGRDPLGQQHRARAAGARARCTSACPTRRSRRPTRCRPTDFAHAAPDLRAAAARAWCSRPTARRSSAALRRGAAAGVELVVSTSPPAACRRRRSPSSRRTPATGGRRRGARDAVGPRHDRQDPVHLGLDRAGRRASSTRSGCSAPTRRCCARCCRSSADEPPVLCDWLPWNHTAGGNHNFGIVLYNGGTLYIDEGKPTPALLRRDAAQPARGRRARRTSPCRATYEMLMPHLRSDAGAARDVLQPAEAALLRGRRAGPALLGRAARLSRSRRAARSSLIMTGFGATETAPFALCTGSGGAVRRHGRAAGAGRGAEAGAGRREARSARCAGRTSRPGYWRRRRR